MAKIAVFASGNGSNFETLAESFKDRNEDKIVVMLCNKKKAFVFERAKKFNIGSFYVKYENDEINKGENEILDIINNNQIDVIFLAGYMRILSADFLKKVSIPVINIHPSILPKYKGTHSIERAFNSEDKEIGISIHYVTEEVDSGEIITQKSIPLHREKGLAQVEEDVHKLEHQWYPVVAKKICDEINESPEKTSFPR